MSDFATLAQAIALPNPRSEIVNQWAPEERERGQKFARRVVGNDPANGLSFMETLLKQAEETSPLSASRNALLVGAYKVFLSALLDLKLVRQLHDLAHSLKIQVRKDTPIPTLVIKILATRDRSLARRYSLFLRAACWSEKTPDELLAGLNDRSIVMSRLINEFLNAVLPPDRNPKPPRLKWSERAKHQYASDGKNHDELHMVIARLQGDVFSVRIVAPLFEEEEARQKIRDDVAQVQEKLKQG